MKELKTTPALVIKAEGNTITGLGTVFGVIDSYGDRSHPGIFAGAVPARVRFLWNHDMESVPIATIDEIREVPRAELPRSVQADYPDATGGALVKRTYLSTARAQEVKAAVLAGAVTDMSYGYDTKHIAFTNLPSGEQVRELYGVDLWEFSDVALRGAVPGTMANIAAAKGYRYAGGFGKQGARHSAADREALDRIHADVVALGATCGSGGSSGKRAPSMAILQRKLWILEMNTLGINTASEEWDLMLDELGLRETAETRRVLARTREFLDS